MMSRVTSTAERRRARLQPACWLLLLLVAAQALPVAWAESAIETLEVTPPRSFGLQIGDRFERRILLRLRAPYRLVTEQLPKAGRHTPWLALAPPGIDERADGATREYHLRLRYQVVNISPDFPDIALPEILLRVSDGQETQQALIPASRLRVGTITDFTGADLRPPLPPLPQPRTTWRLQLWGALLILALTGLAWLRFRHAFGGHARPFADLARSLPAAAPSTVDADWTDDAYGAALRAIHRAFNATAGRTIFGETLDGFFADAPRFLASDAEIREFFRRSNAYFYRQAQAESIYSRAELTRFVRVCADLEDGLS